MKIPPIGEPIVLPDGTRGTLATKRGDPDGHRLWLGVRTADGGWRSVEVHDVGPDMRVRFDAVDLQAADEAARRVIAGIEVRMPVSSLLQLLAHATLARREDA